MGGGKFLKGALLVIVSSLFASKRFILSFYEECSNSKFSEKKEKLCAFTLAEVLITLGVIGVVMAMTLPALIQKQQKMVAVNLLKVTYNKLYNAIRMAEVKEGEAEYWTYYVEGDSVSDNSWRWTNQYLVPYFNKLNVYRDTKLHGCKNVTYKKLDGTVMPCTSVIGFCEVCGSAQSTNMTQLHLIDGAIIIPLVRKTGNETDGYDLTHVEIDIDTNGYKSPNTWGKDIFRLFISSKTKYELNGASHYNLTRAYLLNSCKNDGVADCAGLIMKDGWKIRDDYPWK